LPSTVHAAQRAFVDADDNVKGGGGVEATDDVGVPVDSLGARVRSVFSDQAGGAAAHNIFTVKSEAVRAAAGGAVVGSALWRDAARKLHNEGYAATAVPICLKGKLPEQCGECCISRAVHPGDNVVGLCRLNQVDP
jgi:hypothetical protein